MLGSLSNYRQMLLQIDHPLFRTYTGVKPDSILAQKYTPLLTPFGHGIAGTFAGWTVSFVAAPIEHIKARLQVQYHGKSAASAAIKPRYSGPIDCALQIYRQHGFRALFHGLKSTLVFR